MPTGLLILVAALADLRLSAELVGLRVRATLANDGDEPVQVVVGDSCGGCAFKLIIDGKARPLVGIAPSCSSPHLLSRTLAPGGEYSILSDALDGRHHRLQVQLGDHSSPPLDVPTMVRVDLSLAVTAHGRPGQPIDVEVTHVNRSPEEVALPSCGEDRLLVDGKEQAMPPADGAGCRAEPRVIKVRGAFVTRGRLTLPAGRHYVRARWRDSQSDDSIVDVGMQ
jgi:hypothetical protein